MKWLAEHLDHWAVLCGRMLAWLMLAMVLLQTLIVVLRYGFDIGSIALQESVVYFHATAFMLGAAYTLQADGHVRVDILYRNFHARQKIWLNLLGDLFMLLPFCIVVLMYSGDYVQQSWRVQESSPDPGGLPFVYLLKTLIPTMAVLLILQAAARICRGIATLRGQLPLHKDEQAGGML